METVEVTKENIDEKGNVKCPECGRFSPQTHERSVVEKDMYIVCECDVDGKFVAKIPLK